jgi:hypothetical protein
MANSSGLRHVELHEGVLRSDPSALEQLVNELHLILRRKLRRSLPRVDPDDLADAATDAILVYVAQPHRFETIVTYRSLHLYVALPPEFCEIGCARTCGAPLWKTATRFTSCRSASLGSVTPEPTRFSFKSCSAPLQRSVARTNLQPQWPGLAGRTTRWCRVTSAPATFTRHASVTKSSCSQSA